MFVDLRPAEIPSKSFALQKYFKPLNSLFFLHRNDHKLIKKNQGQRDGVNGIQKKDNFARLYNIKHGRVVENTS